MDQAIRNTLRNAVTKCRKLLEDSVSQELQGKFGIYAAKKDAVQVDDDARMTNLSPEERAARKDILDHFEHIKARGFKPKEALDQLVREIAFTHLNRLCAYKMMDARQVYIGDQRFYDAVGKGVDSKGVMFFLADRPDEERLHKAGKQYVAYRHFLDWLGGQLSDEIGVLFNPSDSANRLYPTQNVLDEVLALLNDEALAEIWTQDETIGWVYQYFTPKDLRDQARKESAAPRNSNELAFRNQFFTPRYVVEFLTDNTLGRIWYEMRKGDTKLKDRCRYMVRRPNEVFLAENDKPPNATEDRDDLSQEELLKQPVNIPHRPKKDPRELKILDPACGSGHFLLYCFDLLLTIYDEAYDDPDLGPVLKKDYSTLADLKKAVPGLILSRNLHGIDIDLRCTQIAALALWLRCHRTYQETGLKKDRPKITRSNIVCAEPMPGEKGLLDDFLKTLHEDRLEALIQRVMQVPEGRRVRATRSMAESLCELIRLVWDKMQLAGEAGSLLQIEEELQDAIRKGQDEWEEKQPLFRMTEFSLREEPKESYLRFVPGEGVSFWERAESLVMAALHDFATYAKNGRLMQRRLFAEDAVQGFAFVDLCRKRFDVVLMNPPFGESSRPSKSYVDRAYPRTRNDLYAAFIEQGLKRLESDARLGAITSRTGFFLSSFQKWREDILLKTHFPTVFADLGNGVLDTAMVETAAYCLGGAYEQASSVFFRLLASDEKDVALITGVGAANGGTKAYGVAHVDPRSFRQVPGSPFAYWVSQGVLALFSEFPRLNSEGREAWKGLITGYDFQWVRLAWEVPLDSHGRSRQDTVSSKGWVPFAKGGEYATYYTDLHLVINWNRDGNDISEWKLTQLELGRITANNSGCWNRTKYFRPGLTWSGRSQQGLSFRALPCGTIFGNKGPGVFVADDDTSLLAAYLGLVNSSPFKLLVSLQMAFGSFEVGVIQRTPFPPVDPDSLAKLGSLVVRVISEKRKIDKSVSTSHAFVAPALLMVPGNTLLQRVAAWSEVVETSMRVTKAAEDEIDAIAFRIYGIAEISEELVDSTQGAGESEVELTAQELPDDVDSAESDSTPASTDAPWHTGDLVAYAVGTLFGRWNLMVAIQPGAEASQEPSPFDPLPACSPGMLQGEDGLALTAQPTNYPISIDSDGILVDDSDHADDMVRRIREVLEVIWTDQAEAIEKEGCEILGAKDLCDYFRKPGKGGFWDDHVSRYSKSRRKAPIYWLLQSAKRNYALWLYYHRLDKDLLFKALVNYVEPKVQRENNRLDEMRRQKQAAGDSGKGAKKLDKEIERQEDLISELRDFEDKLRRAANLHLDPDLNDGVVLNIAPLHELVPWKEAKNYWEELLEGKYEWSTIAKQLRQKGIVK